jgi:2-polyprenyl-3-methyl-5-hydroxy-6-metoxy-1,4-benzoquinol methylase
MTNPVAHTLGRRRVLRRRFDVDRDFKQIEETCLPSYLHRNLAAAGVAWWRLFAAVRLYRRHASAGPVLDFGAGSGELSHLLPSGTAYDFAELDDRMAAALATMQPAAVRRVLRDLPVARYAAIFALDSLEHNDDVVPIMDALVASLRPGGIVIISGPTENVLYRLGRRLAGFEGHYHKATVYDIEQVACRKLTLLRRRTVPLGVPLFSVTAWTRA